MKNALGVYALALSLGPLAGCVQGDLYSSGGDGSGDDSGGASGGVVGTGCGYHCSHPATAVSGSSGSTSGGVSGATSTTGGATTTTGSSSGGHGATTGSPAFPCTDMTAPQAGGSCQSSQIALSGQAIDLVASLMGMGGLDLLPNVGVGAFGCVTPVVRTNDAGAFTLCVTPSTPISPQFTLDAYLTLDVAELNTSTSLNFDGMSPTGGIYMLSDLVQVFLGCSGLTVYPDAGTVVVLVQSLSGAGPCLRRRRGCGTARRLLGLDDQCKVNRWHRRFVARRLSQRRANHLGRAELHIPVGRSNHLQHWPASGNQSHRHSNRCGKHLSGSER